MGDFRSFERGDDRGGRSSGGYGGRSSGGRGGFGGRGRDSGSRDRRDMPMCDAVCAKCGKNCQVPFKPTGDKPVYCSDCFGAQRGESRPSFGGSSAPASGITSEQFQQLNTKLDQILVILNSLEMIDEEDEEDDDEKEVAEEKK
jgi:CxxC-x17-CxxC domain-containing protein